LALAEFQNLGSLMRPDQACEVWVLSNRLIYWLTKS